MSFTLLGIIIVGGFALFGVIGVVLVRGFVKHHVDDGHNEIVSVYYATGIGLLYAFILGLFITNVNSNWASASSITTQEAVTLVPLYRQTSDFAPEKGRAMREALKAYATDVSQDEWPLMAQSGSASPKAQADIGNIYEIFGSLTPANRIREIVDAEFLHTFSNELTLRNQRLAEASPDLQPIIVGVLIIGGLLSVTMPFFMWMRVAWMHILMSGMNAAMIGMLLMVIFVYNNPFQGPLAVNSGAFDSTLATLKTLDASMPPAPVPTPSPK
jgi:hypothetical protein